MELLLDEAHEEYGNGRVVLQRGAPLAVDEYWSLDHDPTKPPLESFVQLQADDRVDNGRFALSATLGERQLVIRLHPETYQEFTRIRTEAKARAGLYLPALTAACQRIARASATEDPEEGPRNSWNAVVDRLLAQPEQETEYKPCYIQRNGSDDDLLARTFGEDLEPVEPEEAAQRLLGAPLGAMLKRERSEEELMEEDSVEGAKKWGLKKHEPDPTAYCRRSCRSPRIMQARRRCVESGEFGRAVRTRHEAWTANFRERSIYTS